RAAAMLAALALVVAPRAAAQNVIAVSPGDDMTLSLQTAIDGAADGDILLLTGDWVSFIFGASVVIDGKGLTLMAPRGTTPEIRTLVVRNVPAGSLVLVRGLKLTQWAPEVSDDPVGVLHLMDCAGAVWIEDCTIDGIDGEGGVFGLSGTGTPGVEIENCAAANLERCLISGGNGVAEDGYGMSWHP